MKAKVFRIYSDQKLIAEVVPGLSGWSEKILNDFYDARNTIITSSP